MQVFYFLLDGFEFDTVRPHWVITTIKGLHFPEMPMHGAVPIGPNFLSLYRGMPLGQIFYPYIEVCL